MRKIIVSIPVIVLCIAMLSGCKKTEEGKSVYLDVSGDIACYAVWDVQDPDKFMIVKNVPAVNNADARQSSEIDLIMETLSERYLYAESEKALRITKDSFPELDQEQSVICNELASHVYEHCRLAVYAMKKFPSKVEEINMTNSVYSVFVSEKEAEKVIGMINQWVSFDSKGNWLFIGTDAYTDLIDLWATRQKQILARDELYYLQ